MSSGWGYGPEDGPAKWSASFPIASEGRRQSPINIQTKEVEFDSSIPPVSVNYGQFTNSKLLNTGHSVMFTGTSDALIRNGPLSHTYNFAQFHFHWGKTNNEGSEHRLNGKMYPGELHIVHYNSDLYPDASTASSSKDGLCVLGFFIEVKGDHENKALKSIFDSLHKVRKSGSSVEVTNGFDLRSVLPSILETWTYPGSLTTPPLYETVTWLVFKNTIEISDEQMNELRSLLNCKGQEMSGNFRPPCPLHGRTVKATFPCC